MIVSSPVSCFRPWSASQPPHHALRSCPWAAIKERKCSAHTQAPEKAPCKKSRRGLDGSEGAVFRISRLTESSLRVHYTHRGRQSPTGTRRGEASISCSP